MKDLSIVIISYNTREITRKCIETIMRSLSFDKEITAEIIIFDNTSTDGSVEEIKNEKRKIKNKNVQLKIIESKENIGFGRGNNEAVKHAEGKCLFFLNSDIEVIEDAIPELYNFVIRKKNPFNFLGGKLLNKDLSPQSSCGPYYSLPVIFGALFLGGDYWGLTRYSPNKTQKADWVSGACFICKKTDFDLLGGFDKKIFMYMEEIDLFYRARKKNMTIGFYPSARFIHLGSASSTKRTQPILHVYNGFLYLYKKHHSRLQLQILKNMLQLKALVALWIGRLTKNKYLTDTYEKAFQITQEIRR